MDLLQTNDNLMDMPVSGHRGPVYMYEYDTTSEGTPWYEAPMFPAIVATLSMDTLSVVVTFWLICVICCNATLRGMPHSWYVLSASLGMMLFSVIDLTGILGWQHVVTTWTQINVLCELLTALSQAGIFAIFVCTMLASVERPVSIMRQVYPLSSFGVLLSRILLPIIWVLGAVYGGVIAWLSVTWEDTGACVTAVLQEPAVAQFLVSVLSLLAATAAIMTSIMWLRSDEVRSEAKTTAKPLLLANIASATVFCVLMAPSVVLYLKRYGDVYSDLLLQKMAYYSLRLACSSIPFLWLVTDADIRGVCCCRCCCGQDKSEAQFLLEDRTPSETAP